MAKSKFYDHKKAVFREELLSDLKNSNEINDFFFEKIREYLYKKHKILDIGTGNGFVLNEIYKRNYNLELDLYGIDNSDAMIETAKKLFKNAKFQVGDNYSLPFENGFFDIITAKNVTKFSPYEALRVLKNKGVFILREYGSGKGLVEIADMFPGKIIRARKPSFYMKSLNKAGFKDIESKELKTINTYSPEVLKKVLKSFPFIKNYSKKDESKIFEHYNNQNPIMITSDPIIIIARKK